jgi:anti-sigma factor RsiW
MSADERDQLDAHLEGCGACRSTLDDQLHVARVLHARVETPVPAGFAARLATRLDSATPGHTSGRAEGVLSLANWRRWTVSLVPIAAALVLMAYLGVGASGEDSVPTTVESGSISAALDNWAGSPAVSTPASVFLQPSSSGDQLLETVLTGAVPISGGATDVR